MRKIAFYLILIAIACGVYYVFFRLDEPTPSGLLMLAGLILLMFKVGTPLANQELERRKKLNEF